MFDIGWSELLLIGVIILFAFGPEDIPKIMYNFGRVMRRFRYMRYALSSQFEDFMEKAENTTKVKAAATGATAATVAAAPQGKVTHDDEADDDAHLMDMMPLPNTDTAQLPAIDNEEDERANRTPAADRG